MSARTLLLVLLDVLLGIFLGLLIGKVTLAATPRPASEPRWVPVHVEGSSSWGDPSYPAVPAAKAAEPTAPHRAASTPGLILDPATPTQSVERPAVAPTAELHVVSVAPVAPQGGSSVTGIASYYAWHVGEAAAGPALRVGDWRGRVVTVCTSACVVVRLTDYMANPNAVIDLNEGDFATLAPLSVGLIRVTVSWN